MHVMETQTIEQEVLTDVLCNQCGKSIKGHIGNYNGIQALMTSAYDSEVLPDDNLCLTFAMCESCVVELAKGFKLPMWDQTEEQPYEVRPTGRQLAARAKIRGMKLERKLYDALMGVAAGNKFEIGHEWDLPLKELEVLRLVDEDPYTYPDHDPEYSTWRLLDAGQAMLDREQGVYAEDEL